MSLQFYGGNSRDSSGTTANQAIQSSIELVATMIGAERKRNRDPKYPLYDSPAQFDVRRGELLFSTGLNVTDPATGLHYTSSKNKGKAFGVWSCFNGQGQDEEAIFQGVSMTDWQQGPVDRSRTNQATIAVAWDGIVNVPCSDPLLRVGEQVMIRLPPRDTEQLKLDVYAANSIGVDSANRRIATVVGYRPAGEQHCLPMMLYRSAKGGGKTSGIDGFDDLVAPLWKGIAEGDVSENVLNTIIQKKMAPRVNSSKLVAELGGGIGGRRKAAFVVMAQALFDAAYKTTFKVIGTCVSTPTPDGRCSIRLRT